MDALPYDEEASSSQILVLIQDIIFREKLERLVKFYMFCLGFNANFNRACKDKKADSSRFRFSTKTFFEGMAQFLCVTNK